MKVLVMYLKTKILETVMENLQILENTCEGEVIFCFCFVFCFFEDFDRTNRERDRGGSRPPR